MPASSRSAPTGMEAAGIYLPNGNSGGEAGYDYKLRWMDRLGDWVAARLDDFTPVAVLGDFNVCPTEADLAPGALPPTDALVRPESRARFRAADQSRDDRCVAGAAPARTRPTPIGTTAPLSR